jgi:hypothetical protein
MLRELSHRERADLLRRVQMLTASEFSVSQRRLTARRWLIRFRAEGKAGEVGSQSTGWQAPSGR